MSELSYSDKEAMRIYHQKTQTGHRIARKNAAIKNSMAKGRALEIKKTNGSLQDKEDKATSLMMNRVAQKRKGVKMSRKFLG